MLYSDDGLENAFQTQKVSQKISSYPKMREHI